ncbi:hypothetical protein [Acetobacter estunensis]|uniref:hypothetical protein n=1 Tax=Acetobacter estunensis TaxID=104097 RepID=UPI001C2D8BEC|nr:hypothetical protein [Acetobacter estunensis]MBV1836205.1 hypothetical protein [Acetobacter estunensis]
MKHQLLALADEKFLASDFLGAAEAIREYMELFPTGPRQAPTASTDKTNGSAKRLHLKNEIAQ